LRQAAIHEAGHAVANRVVGMVCGEASIVPDCDGMSVGVAIFFEEPELIERAWKQRGKWRGQHHSESVMIGRIIGYMAGREAEIIAFGTKHEIGDGSDLLQIALMAEQAGVSEAYLARLRTKVGPLLRRHWHKVEAVAEQLLVRKSLSGHEIDSVIRKVTTPLERAIARRIVMARKSMPASARQDRAG
jgi:ATP-dependent Zn protease